MLSERGRVAAAFWLHSLLGAPLMALYTMLPFIIYREMEASSLQVTLLVMLKPMVSLISFHWSYWSEARTHNLRHQLLLSETLCRLPFLLLPLMFNSWGIIMAAALYITTHRGGTPAWMELLRRELNEQDQRRVWAIGSNLFYIGLIASAIFLGVFLDGDPSAWRWVAPLCGGTGAILLPLLYGLHGNMQLEQKPRHGGSSFFEPWAQSSELLRRRHPFTNYQWGFFIAGSGLILMQPSFPSYFSDYLELSYRDVATAISVCKGIGFAATTHLWSRLLTRERFLELSGVVASFGALFAVYLLLASAWTGEVFVAFIFYGVMQAGSELTWNLAGPLFSGSSDSRAYTRLSILMQGLRGAVVPPLGALVAQLFTAPTVISLGGTLCILGSYYLIQSAQQHKDSAKLAVT